MLKNLDWIKTGLIGGMLICIMLLLREWEQFSAPPPLTENQGSETEHLSAPPSAETPFTDPAIGLNPNTPANNASPLATTNTSLENIIDVKTDVLNLKIDLSSGDFVQADLIEVHQKLDNDVPFRLLNKDAQHTYVAKSGLLVNGASGYRPINPTFVSSKSNFELSAGQEELVVELTSQQDGFVLIKRLRFQRGEYLVGVEHEIQNTSATPWQGAFYAQIDRDDREPPTSSGFGMKPYVGAAITEPDDNYNKIDFGDLKDETYTSSAEKGWVALIQHYFVSAWIPVADQSVSYKLGKYSNQNLYYHGFTQSTFSVLPGQSETIVAGFYVGPKDQYRLKEIAKHLDLTVDYSWLWWAAQPLFWLLQFIHSFVANWGVAIILLTCTVKLLFFPLSAASFRSMARMRKLTPKMQALKERHGDDRQALSQEMMKLYKKEQVNPMGGCLPILIQMPIFLALYWVLLESVELRHAPFFGWIQDLSAKDPWFILPVLMGLSMVVQQRLNPTPPDPMQAKVIKIVPIGFAIMMAWFPAGLVLYWTVNNLLSITQQWVITRRIEAEN